MRPRAVPSRADYADSIAQALAAAEARAGAARPEEGPAAAGAVTELLRLPAAARPERVKADARLHTYSAWRLLYDHSQARAGRSGRGAEALARLALAAACRLDERRYGEGLVADCRVLAAVAAARARLSAGELEGAERALEVAGLYLDRASGDPRVRAELHVTWGQVARAAGRLHQARGSLRRAVEMLRRAGEDERERAVRAEEAEVLMLLRNQGRPRPRSPVASRPVRLVPAPALSTSPEPVQEKPP